MEEEVAKLRAYIIIHVGSLNMRLLTLGLSVQILSLADKTDPHMVTAAPLQLLQINIKLPDQAWNLKWTICTTTSSRAIANLASFALDCKQLDQ